MTIQYAILGFLSWQPLSGYDLKKLFAGSHAFHWSGNNNQIYRSLVQLHDEGLVTVEVQPQADRPPRKVYTITPRGRQALRQWLRSPPELPQLRSTFLVQLAWAGELPPEALDSLLAQYEHEVEMQLLMCREQARRGGLNPARTPRERHIWQMIAEHPVAAYEAELAWLRRLRQGLAEQGGPDS